MIAQKELNHSNDDGDVNDDNNYNSNTIVIRYEPYTRGFVGN